MPSLSWNAIRTRAAGFARDWHGKGYEKGDTHLFYQEFFQLFGMPVRRIASFEAPVKKLGAKQGFIDLFWKGVLLVEQKSAGRSLALAREQALEYFDGLSHAELPRYILLSDFQRFELIDLESGAEVAFPLAELPDHVEHFAFIRGDEVLGLAAQDAVNIRAAELIGHLHDLLSADHYTGQDLQTLLVRLVFCLFADDTGIFEGPPSGPHTTASKHPFAHLIHNRSAEGGRDLGRLLMELFEVLNTPDTERQSALDEDLAQFPYINGALFAGPIRTPVFDAAMREALLAACAFDWRAVSPAIFGSLFQSVMDAGERRTSGAHYTGEAHILRVIKPLFLDALDAEFDRICTMKQKGPRDAALHAFHDTLAAITLFDPACGCGNFLVIAYQTLRAMETALLKTLHDDGQLKLDTRVLQLSRLNVDQCYGIEIGPFAARIAQVALWMADHLCNLELGDTFGRHDSRIPLTTAPHIHCMDALDSDWHAVLPAAKCRYVLGNPPFVGKSYQSPEQSAQIKAIAADAGLKSGAGTLDYVCAWWIKAAQYAHSVTDAATAPRIGFVSTNSITQGEQVAALWPLLLERCQREITFAHRTFAWSSEARGAAHVHVVVIGLAPRGSGPAEKRLFSYPDLKGDPTETRHRALSPYLIDASALPDANLVVRNEKRHLMGYPDLIMGSKPVEGGHYILTDDEKAQFLNLEPDAAPFLHPFIGAQEFINGSQRWILALHHAEPHVLRTLPEVLKRIDAVKQFRLASKKAPTRQLAETPRLFEGNILPETPFLVIPETSSENRDYIPIGYLEPPVIPSNALRILPNAHKWHFAILTSRMHMAWMRQFAGRLKSDYRYSIGVVYNAFPWPAGLQADHKAQTKLDTLAQAVLDARAAHPGSTLAHLYDPVLMPPDLKKAHLALDKAVDSLYQKAKFADDAARVAHLLGLYAGLRA